MIDLRDANVHALVWRGIASEERATLDNMIKKAFEKYPPKLK